MEPLAGKVSPDAEKLSVVVITFNEEANIGRCLASVQDLADEIVVVDSLSTDRTAEIAAGMGARVIRQAFLGHVAQKNLALDQASFDLVLSLDADEVLDDKARASVVAVKRNRQADGYTFNRLTSYCGHWVRYCGWYPDRKLRLWDRRKGRWGGRNPHDKVLLVRDARIELLDGQIRHYSFYSIDQHVRQIQSFTTIGAREAFEAGERYALIKMLVKPPFKFFRDYVLKGGFLDGWYGLVICVNGAWSRFLKYAKLRVLQCQPEGMRVLHLDAGQEWRGGQKQVYYLHTRLLDLGLDSHVAVHARGELYRALKADGIAHVHAWSGVSRKRMSRRELRRILREVKPSVVHFHDRLSLAFAGEGCMRKVATRRVSYPVSGWARWWLYRRMNVLVGVSATITRYWKRYLDEVETIPSAIDTDYFARSQTPGVLDRGPGLQILFVGAFSAQKGLFVLLDALEILEMEGLPFRAHLVGTGELFGQVEARIRAAGMDDAVRLYGPVRDIAPCYRAADVLVVPSVDGEGSSGTIKEGQASGIVVVASDIAPNRELVTDGRDGFLFRVQDGEDLARVLREVAAGKSPDAGKVAERVKGYSIATMVERYVNVYRRLVGGGG